ncbi:MAG: DUF4329 domain-containing protein [Clostridia bacterium]|nr:DUF4329 domain-containing protein [Clostridia bacterium]
MIKLKIGSRILDNDGQITSMDTAPFLKDSRTFVPLRFIAEAFGKVVEWVNDTKEVIIYNRQKYFETADECAFDWGMHFNCMSIALFREMGAIIYKDDNGYYWDSVKIGKDKEVYWSIPEVRKGVAFIHSHSGGMHSNTKSMSSADFKCAKDCKRPLYMVDSGGCLWVYNPTEDKPKQKLVQEGLPKDVRWMSIADSSKLQAEYFSSGYISLDEFEFGFKADYYNKLHMKGLSYLKEVAVL